MKIKHTYKHPHSAFKLEGVLYDNISLAKLAEQYRNKGEGYQVSLGRFIMQWIDASPELTLQTSGSTGAPKTVFMSKQAMVNSAIATGDYFKLTAGNTALSCLPFEYIAAKMMFVRAYALGLDLYCVQPCSNPLKGSSKVYDFCAMVPLQVEQSIHDLHQIKTLIVGGAALSKTLTIKLKNSPTNSYETFGMTETVSHIAVKNISTSSTVFEVLPSISVGVDSRNCLYIEAPHIISTPIQTNDVINLISKTSFEWIGRYDTIINSGGLKIAPEKLEQHLEGFIEDRFFIGSQKDDTLGEVIVIVIERSSAYKTLDFDVLEPFMRPKYVYYVEQFIETVSGKIKRKETLALVTPE